MTLLGGLSQVEKADNEIQKIVNGVIFIFYVHIFFFLKVSNFSRT